MNNKELEGNRADYEIISDGTRKDGMFVFMEIFLIGVAIGSAFALALNEEIIENIIAYFSVSVEKYDNRSFLLSLTKIFFSEFPMLFLVFLSGFSAVGFPMTALVPLFRGIWFGALSVSMYVTNGISAFFEIVLKIFSGTFIFISIISLACFEASEMSKNVYSVTVRGIRDDEIKYRIRRYCTKYSVIWVAAVIGAAIEAGLLRIKI